MLIKILTLQFFKVMQQWQVTLWNIFFSPNCQLYLKIAFNFAQVAETQSGRVMANMYGNMWEGKGGLGGGWLHRPACLPTTGSLFLFLAAKFLSGGAPKSNCRRLSTGGYTLSSILYSGPGFSVLLYSNSAIQEGATSDSRYHITACFWTLFVSRHDF